MTLKVTLVIKDILKSRKFVKFIKTRELPAIMY